MTPEESPDTLFATQHGVAADRQLRAAGITWGRQQRMIENERWRRHSPGVVALVGAPQTWHQRCMAATLSLPGLALVSGRSAARLHDFDGFQDTSDVEIVVPTSSKNRTAPEVRVRWSRHLSAADRHMVAGIPVAIQPLTLAQLAADGLSAGKALDAALRQGKSPLWLRRELERWDLPGVHGPSLVLTELDARMGKRLPRSWFQRLAKEIFRADGIVMEDEWPVRDGTGKVLATLDLAVPPARVGVECQSIAYHASAADISRDIRRKRTLRRMGWDIVELWWTDLNRSDEVMSDVRAALGRARHPGS